MYSLKEVHLRRVEDCLFVQLDSTLKDCKPLLLQQLLDLIKITGLFEGLQKTLEGVVAMLDLQAIQSFCFSKYISIGSKYPKNNKVILKKTSLRGIDGISLGLRNFSYLSHDDGQFNHHLFFVFFKSLAAYGEGYYYCNVGDMQGILFVNANAITRLQNRTSRSLDPADLNDNEARIEAASGCLSDADLAWLSLFRWCTLCTCIPK